MMRKVSFCSRSFPLKKAFRISRGAKKSAEVVTVELIERGLKGRGEAVPYARYGESVQSVLEQIDAIKNDLQNAPPAFPGTQNSQIFHADACVGWWGLFLYTNEL